MLCSTTIWWYILLTCCCCKYINKSKRIVASTNLSSQLWRGKLENLNAERAKIPKLIVRKESDCLPSSNLTSKNPSELQYCREGSHLNKKATVWLSDGVLKSVLNVLFDEAFVVSLNFMKIFSSYRRGK